MSGSGWGKVRVRVCLLRMLSSHGGCTFPVSYVAGGFGSHFMDASASGDDVFIATTDQLVPSDTDSREDVYDVSVGGGFAVQVAPAVCASADECNPVVSGEPGVFGAPASATFSGAGNLAAPSVAAPPPVSPRCGKGFVEEAR